MRFVYITCNVSMLEQMESLLRELEISVYQVIPKALAESNFDIPHKDTAVWPGFNACLLVQEADTAKGDAAVHQHKLNKERRISRLRKQIKKK